MTRVEINELIVLGICTVTTLATLVELRERRRRKALYRSERRRGVLYTPGKYYGVKLFSTLPSVIAVLSVLVGRHLAPGFTLLTIVTFVLQLALLSWNLTSERREYRRTGPWLAR